MSFQFGGTPTTTSGGISNFNFGAQNQPKQTTAPANWPAPGTAAPTFGGLGAIGSAAPVTAAPTLSFGAVGSLGGGIATTSAPNFNFGTPSATTQPVSRALPLFGAATTSSATTATVAPTLNFGTGGGIGGTSMLGTATAATTTATGNFGTGFGLPNASTTTAAPTIGSGGGLGTFSFAKPAPSATTSVATLNFGTNTTAANATTFNTAGVSGIGGSGTSGVGIFGKPLSTTNSSNTLGPPPSTTTAPFVGLGGTDVGSTQPKPGDAKLDTIKVKETQVPDEIAKTVDALKQYIKEQKTICSDIGRTSTSKFTNTTSEIINSQWALQGIANSVETNHQQIKLLRAETSKAIQAVEMAQRTQDTPTGLQFENNAPCQYFQALVARYEQDLINFRQQIVLTERHMQALANPQNISPEDLKRGFKQINESFVSLAGRLHEIHQKVEEQKEHYLNLRKYRLRDATNVFEKIDNPPQQSHTEPQRISSGPTPFSNINTLSKSYMSASNTTSSSPSAVAK